MDLSLIHISFWQQRIRETVRHALNVHPRLTALRVCLLYTSTGLRPDRLRAQLVLQAGHPGTGGMVGKRCHERPDQRIPFPAGAGRYGHNRMYGPEQPEYRICFLTNVLCLCGRRLNAGPIPVSYTHLDVYKRQPQ